ncbi:hypothetical protein [Lactobacillus taiwanensis]|uniref:hypothetical protein n=1 Tax=Lactobacillus taiwanensis TaxID=508451 RepID=UPI0025A942EB|nr:hypothetical protein [Lactobacillus taiwanensis]
MAIVDYNKYQITKHAKERIKKRFGLLDSEIKSWTTRFLSNCKFVSKQDQNREKHKYGEIVAILDVVNKNVITVYHESSEGVGLEKAQRNPEVQTALNAAMNEFIKTKRKSLSKKMVEVDAPLREAMRKFKKSPNEDNYTELCITLNSLNEEIEKFNTIVGEAKVAMGVK